jgi:membrane associated rhomboid family serine protease
VLRRPTATATIAIVTVVVSLAAMWSGVHYWAVFGGFIPARMTNELILQGAVPAVLTPWSSALLHGSLLHLGVNLLILVYAGMQVERVIGKSGLIIAYLLGALAAAAAQFAVDPSGTVPMVGASGAISALFGLYALLYGQPKQVTSHRRINRSIHVLWLLVTWVVLQWMAGVLAGGQGVMLATPAHIGGFVAGLLMQRPLLLWRYRKA